MDFIKSEMDKEFNAVGFKNQRRNLKYRDHQIGKTNRDVDSKRNAMLPGKRISKTGKIFYEYRKNRTDSKGSNL